MEAIRHGSDEATRRHGGKARRQGDEVTRRRDETARRRVDDGDSRGFRLKQRGNDTNSDGEYGCKRISQPYRPQRVALFNFYVTSIYRFV